MSKRKPEASLPLSKKAEVMLEDLRVRFLMSRNSAIEEALTRLLSQLAGGSCGQCPKRSEPSSQPSTSRPAVDGPVSRYIDDLFAQQAANRQMDQNDRDAWRDMR